ncbi:hypothetical protein D8S78_11435 [Natrialba swarupiae]|nr:hypothetical protein [Natrialba swarupiae]
MRRVATSRYRSIARRCTIDRQSYGLLSVSTAASGTRSPGAARHRDGNPYQSTQTVRGVRSASSPVGRRR